MGLETHATADLEIGATHSKLFEEPIEVGRAGFGAGLREVDVRLHVLVGNFLMASLKMKIIAHLVGLDV